MAKGSAPSPTFGNRQYTRPRPQASQLSLSSFLSLDQAAAAAAVPVALYSYCFLSIFLFDPLSFLFLRGAKRSLDRSRCRSVLRCSPLTQDSSTTRWWWFDARQMIRPSSNWTLVTTTVYGASTHGRGIQLRRGRWLCVSSIKRKKSPSFVRELVLRKPHVSDSSIHTLSECNYRNILRTSYITRTAAYSMSSICVTRNCCSKLNKEVARDTTAAVQQYRTNNTSHLQERKGNEATAVRGISYVLMFCSV